MTGSIGRREVIIVAKSPMARRAGSSADWLAACSATSSRRAAARRWAPFWEPLAARSRVVRSTGTMSAAHKWSRAGRGDRKSVVEGKSVSVRVDIGGRRLINKQPIISDHNLHAIHNDTTCHIQQL